MAKKPTKSTETNATAAVFGTAAVIETPTSNSKKKDKPQVKMGTKKDSFKGYVSLILVEKALEGAKKQLEEQFKDRDAFEYFHDRVVKTGSQPSAMEGVEDCAVAQFQFKKRSAGFDEAVAERLAKNNITCERVESIPERFVINPLLLQDQVMLEKLSKAILGLGLDYQVVEKQKPKFKYQFNDATIKQVSELKDPVERAEILRAISSIAVAQAKLDVEGNVLDAALEILREEGILNAKGE